MGTLISSILAGSLSFLAASLSSAGGVGGGSLYLPIINLVAGLDLKSSAAISAFMVTGGSISNVIYTLFSSTPSNTSNKSLIDYEIALLSEPCMLLGVSVGVVCNVVFPEWLITVLFALFLGASTFKTFRAGFRCWDAESEEVVRRFNFNCGDDADEEGKGLETALLLGSAALGRRMIPWAKLAVLVMIWLSFFALHVLVGYKGGKNILQIKPCGVVYWLVTLFQVPLALVFTSYILYVNHKSHHQMPDPENDGKIVVVNPVIEKLPVVVFPLAALLSGILGGLFGIGGGLLINPVLLQIGIPPQVTAATTSFMVLFSSSMSMVQYLIIGMTQIKEALVFAMICFVASVLGLVLIQRAIEKSGRISLIVFSVSTVMGLSTVSVTLFGAIDVWRGYESGKSMGFKLPC